ncbi:MAG: TIGR04282 family arsenosugar biosynthesis glycosyltransferase [Terriglobia bacterium]
MFARTPVPGRAKTRLIPALGPESAARLQQALLCDAAGKARAMQPRVTAYLALAGRPFGLPDHINSLPTILQRGADLGGRLQHVFSALFRRHPRVVAIGTDSPELSPALLRQALGELDWCEAVVGPCPDGGYYLVGLRRGVSRVSRRQVFGRVRWGTRWALGDTLRGIVESGLSCSLLEPCADIDRPRDLRRLAAAMLSDPAYRRRAPHTWRFIAALAKNDGRGRPGPAPGPLLDGERKPLRALENH